MKHYIIFLALLMSMSSIRAQESNSIGSLLATIEQNNLELKALRHNNNAELLNMKAENTVSGPSIEFSPFYKRGLHTMPESELIISEEFDFPTRYRDRSKQTRLQEDVLRNTYNAKRNELLLEAEIITLDIIRLSQIRSLYDELLQEWQTMLDVLGKKSEDGSITALDVNRCRLEYSQTKKELLTTENELKNQTEKLRLLNGGQSLSVGITDFPNYEVEQDFETFLHQALQNNSQLQIAQAELRASEFASKTARRQWLPSINIGYRMNTSMGEKTNGMLVGASFPLFSVARNKKAANERLTSAQINLQQEQETTTQQLRTIYNQLTYIDQILSLGDKQVLDSTLTLLNKSLQQQHITITQYISEKNDIYSQLTDIIELQHQKAILCATLTKKLG